MNDINKTAVTFTVLKMFNWSHQILKPLNISFIFSMSGNLRYIFFGRNILFSLFMQLQVFRTKSRNERKLYPQPASPLNMFF